ncbi:MAG TPA: 50S ribosomal protein L11 methyltransferase [Candidatus Omnitrophota bacterium]|jgi:ribosomal protein L11 methyltransferase|nr:50S ribosomal protein L11 methyltransferase [Candidatus Omnitrophota bacterium]
MNVPSRLREFNVSGRGLSPREKEAVRAEFLRAKVPPAALAIWDYKKHFRIGCYGLARAKEKCIVEGLKSAGIRGFHVRGRSLAPGDWFYKWRETCRVMTAGRKFLIVPAWRKAPRTRSKRIPVILDPGSAFGTGGHETTQLMVRLMEGLEGRFRSFLDAGTGSGVLAIVAAKLGAVIVAGFDNDAMSVKIAAKNYRVNGCEGGRFFRASLGKLPAVGRFDLVGANLLSKTLLEYRSRLIDRLAPGGYLAVSGIAKRHFPDFRKRFATPRLRLLKVMTGRSWASALYRRRSAQESRSLARFFC